MECELIVCQNKPIHIDGETKCTQANMYKLIFRDLSFAYKSEKFLFVVVISSANK